MTIRALLRTTVLFTLAACASPAAETRLVRGRLQPGSSLAVTQSHGPDWSLRIDETDIRIRYEDREVVLAGFGGGVVKYDTVEGDLPLFTLNSPGCPRVDWREFDLFVAHQHYDLSQRERGGAALTIRR